MAGNRDRFCQSVARNYEMKVRLQCPNRSYWYKTQNTHTYKKKKNLFTDQASSSPQLQVVKVPRRVGQQPREPDGPVGAHAKRPRAPILQLLDRPLLRHLARGDAVLVGPLLEPGPDPAHLPGNIGDAPLGSDLGGRGVDAHLGDEPADGADALRLGGVEALHEAVHDGQEVDCHAGKVHVPVARLEQQQARGDDEHKRDLLRERDGLVDVLRGRQREEHVKVGLGGEEAVAQALRAVRRRGAALLGDLVQERGGLVEPHEEVVVVQGEEALPVVELAGGHAVRVRRAVEELLPVQRLHQRVQLLAEPARLVVEQEEVRLASLAVVGRAKRLRYLLAHLHQAHVVLEEHVRGVFARALERLTAEVYVLASQGVLPPKQCRVAAPSMFSWLILCPPFPQYKLVGGSGWGSRGSLTPIRDSSIPKRFVVLRLNASWPG